MGFVVLKMCFNDIYESLAVFDVSLPYPVATDDDELVGLLSIEGFDVRLAGDHLLVVP